MYVTSSVTPPTPPAAAASAAPVASKAAPPGAKDADKRARRGFSIDFRSLGFGAPEKPEPKPQLKPLQLASRAAPAGQSPPKTQSSPAVAIGASLASGVAGARKLAPQEEDEEDRRERSRMEANLKLMGITSPASEAAPLEEKPPTPTATAVSGAAGWFSRRLSRASAPAPAPAPVLPEGQRGSTTPLSRLSTALSDSSSARVELDAQDPEAALRAFDAREREQARLLAEGKNTTAFTAPPRVSSRRNRSSNGSTLSRNSAQSFSMSGTSSATSPSVSAGGEKGGSAGGVETIADKPIVASPSQHRGRESISTLWSMGSSHDHE
jgi:hypothetical protein